MGEKKPLMVSSPRIDEFSCMGKTFSTKEFCLKKNEKNELPFLRGMVVKKKDEIYCQYGPSAVISVSCDKRDSKRFCRDEKKGCEKLKSIYAHELKYHYHSMQMDSKGDETLSCFFTSADKKFNLDEKDPFNL